jgi:hypothetical protein
MIDSTSTPADRIVQGLLSDLPSLIAVAVVDVGTGMMLASHSNYARFNLDLAAAYNTQVVKQSLKAMKDVSSSTGKLEEILVTVADQLHLIKLLLKEEVFVFLAVNSLDINMAMATQMIQRHTPEFI